MIYLIIFLVCLFCACYYDMALGGHYPRHWYGNGAYLLILVLFVLMAGLRHHTIGADTGFYYEDFLKLPEFKDMDSSVYETSRYQPGWLTYVALIKQLGGSFNITLLVEAIFVNTVILRFFWKYTKIPFLCTLIFFISPNFIEFNTEIMREAFAISICLLAFESYLKKRYIIAILLWYVAYNFHVSSLIALFFPLFNKIKYKRSILLIGCFIVIFVMVIFSMLSEYSTEIAMFFAGLSSKFFNLYDFYYNTELDAAKNTNYYIILFVTKFVVPLIMILYLKQRSNNVFGFVLAYMFFQILTAYSEAFYRFANYEGLFYTILVAQFIYTFTKKSCSNQLERVIFFTLALVVFIYIFQSMQFVQELGQSNFRYERYIPYKFFFDNVP